MRVIRFIISRMTEFKIGRNEEELFNNKEYEL
jgi:hypothetical protein